MSDWKDILKEDIEKDGEDLNVLIGSDDFGNNYIILKIKDVLEVLGITALLKEKEDEIAELKDSFYNAKRISKNNFEEYDKLLDKQSKTTVRLMQVLSENERLKSELSKLKEGE